MRCRPPTSLQARRGAALLMAMLTVALVASLAAAALWRQWRGVEVEAAERGRLQARWILTGALDWGRLILRQDAISSGNVDHLAEPWAIPLAEARLSTFLSGGDSGPASSGDDAMDAFLTGGITDLQGRLNAYNLIENSQVVATQQVAFQRLFALLNLPQAELETLIVQLQASLPRSRTPTGTSAPSSTTASTSQDDEAIPIAPVRFADLGRLGLSASTLARLAPFVTWLPARTMVNLNTAPVEVLYAIIDGIDTATARKIEQQRSQTHFTSLQQAQSLLDGSTGSGTEKPPTVNARLHSINSNYFQITGQVRIDDIALGEQAVVERRTRNVRMLDRLPLSQLAGTQAAMTAGLP